MEIYQILISAFITIFAIGLLSISLASYRKYKTMKLLVVSGVFLVFFIHGILQSIGLFYPTEFSFLSSPLITGVFDMIVLVFLFIATLKR